MVQSLTSAQFEGNLSLPEAAAASETPLRRQSKAASKSTRRSITLEALVRLYLADLTGLSAARRREKVQLFENHVFPKLGARRVHDLVQSDIRSLLQGLENRHTPGQPLGAQRNRIVAALQVVFTWAATDELIERSPIVSSRRLKIREYAGERQLHDSELQQLWSWLNAPEATDDPLRCALALLLLLLRRSSEVTQAPKAEFDLDAGLWHLPPHRNKSRQDLHIPLPASVVVLLKQQFARAPSSKWLFPSRYATGQKSIDRPVHSKSIEKCLDRYFEAYPGPKFSVKDFRPTGRTRIGNLGVPKYIGPMLLGHSDVSVDGRHYDRTDYMPDIRQAFALWHNEIERISKRSL